MDTITNSKLYFAAILMVSIIFISIIFHFDLRIIDALSLEIVPDYDIQISALRILFEPVIGVLLFFNRSLFALEELVYLLVWVLFIYMIHSIFFILRKDKSSKKKKILKKLADIPLIIGLWFTFFVFTIFIPLPNNTIINNSDHSVLVATHAHTKYSHDGLISQEDQWKWHKKNGYDAFYITDHNNHNHTLEFVNSQRNKAFPMEPLVMCGEEFSGKNHLSLLGLKRKFSTKGLSHEAVVDSVHANGGVVLVNHWFDGEKMSLENLKQLGVDGFEIENTATERTYDRNVYKKLKSFVSENNLIMHGGLDFHGYGNVCSIWNAFKIPNWDKMNPTLKEESILSIFKSHDQDKLQVLLYQDRPYYNSENLIFRPVITVFNYFRTLNIYQVASWFFWILISTLVANMFRLKSKRKPPINIILLSMLSSAFILLLGVYYYLKIENIEGFSEVFEEYSTMLFEIGFAFLIYTAIVAYFRKRKSIQ